jgi:hypothetical protein
MHKSATKCNETIGKWYKNKHGASKIIDTFETYHHAAPVRCSYKLCIAVALFLLVFALLEGNLIATA